MDKIIFEAMKELNEDLLLKEVSTDYTDSEFNFERGWATFLLLDSSDDKPLYIQVDLTCEISDVDVEWEPDGEPTYVPYGEQSVMYDDGKGGVESIDASNAISADGYKLVDEDNNEYSFENVCEMLRCEPNALTDEIQHVKDLAVEYYIDYIEDSYEPERPEDNEPDYDPYDYD